MVQKNSRVVGEGLRQELLIVDIHEPEDATKKFETQQIQTLVIGLNSAGLADYAWVATDGHIIQLERKQNNELLASLDDVERQLRQQYGLAQENGLLIEGLTAPITTSRGTFCGVYKLTQDRKFAALTDKSGIPYREFVAWCYRLDKSGVTVYQTVDWDDTVQTIAALFRNSQKPEHTTLQRYIKPKITLQDYNPHILMLMSIPNCLMGEVRARALIDRFGTFWNVIHATESELCSVVGIGQKLTRQILRGVGKE